MGFKYSMANVQEGGNLSPYLQVKKIDSRWLEAIGYEGASKEVRHVSATVKGRKDSVATVGEWGRGCRGYEMRRTEDLGRKVLCGKVWWEGAWDVNTCLTCSWKTCLVPLLQHLGFGRVG
jgi:hypothetical protein